MNNNNLIAELKERIIKNEKKIKMVFPEGNDERIILAVDKLIKEKVLIPTLLGEKAEIHILAKKLGVDLSEVEIISPNTDSRFEEVLKKFMEIRKGKVTEAEARNILKDVNYYGTMLLELGIFDGMVSGAIHSTGDTVRPALQIIKTKKGISKISGAMVMLSPTGEKYIFADVAININLTAEEMAEIAIESGKTAKIFGIDPKVAMLSFSTNGSASSKEQEKVATATKLAKAKIEELNLDFEVDGEMQFDAAIDPKVGKLKFKDSKVAGNATVFVFPDLEAGNIGYKIAQRLASYNVIGPILQGLNKPINDLSRGCDVNEIYNTAIVTALQALNK